MKFWLVLQSPNFLLTQYVHGQKYENTSCIHKQKSLPFPMPHGSLPPTESYLQNSRLFQSQCLLLYFKKYNPPPSRKNSAAKNLWLTASLLLLNAKLVDSAPMYYIASIVFAWSSTIKEFSRTFILICNSRSSSNGLVIDSSFWESCLYVKNNLTNFQIVYFLLLMFFPPSFYLFSLIKQK